MNIVIFTDTYYPDTNGIAISSKILVDALKANGHQVLVITSIYGNKSKEKETSVIHIPFPVKGNRGFFSTKSLYLRTAYKQVKAFKPDIIHDQTNGQIGQLGRYTAKQLDVPFVYTYHTYHEKYATYVDGGLFKQIARASERRYFQKMTNISTEFISPSLKIKNYLRKKGNDKYINVIPIGMDPKWFEADDVSKKDNKYIHKKYNIPEDSKILLFVGSLLKEKAIDVLIKTFKQYVDEYDDNPYLLIAGDGDQLDELQKLVKELDLEEQVIFLGKVGHEKIKSYYLMADVLVSASLSETQSVAIIEAMAASSIVLAKDENLLSELIDDEINGFIYSDDSQFVNKLRRILTMDSGDLEKIKTAARKKIIASHNVDKYAEKILEVYNRAQRKYW